ncbi:ABC transporter substrate-binding protein [Streptomyces lunaelactis]|uniref:ABC transporter substrate-binding protein n=1 Tax=Streptomyces lunaelactis TaxID=1535768 RepID=UPI001584F643|nr:ABC transporter substrate-binding protein [Streptomyces lunaelactis]NUK34028.1 ABC transporter substrate-binding protein [Streptomyces lunaelactis]NUK41917.1 ABC transporter substrate-binding protein [Streptomyces lunaelactis]NUK71510.1 ABC transporter substrate-binding protein [Streptomyces lunaelactis]NUK81914.1 ABC transporter substrate-binding protein [Streptomyces lunaelactis]NUK92256.1 ABC transporter substrate-binding protein [Streptomyces lunaelactis]
MRPRRAAEALLLAALTTGIAACGSRLPESDFEGSPSPVRSSGGEPIRIGIIASATSPVGGAAFTGPGEGAKAYFDALNAQGGVDGRRIEVATCDDGGSGVGNNECVHKLIDEKKVFALVATTALDYAGAPLVAKAGVPDIGGQPIGPAYDTYPHLYGIYGSLAPRDGGKPGWDGTLYGGTEVYRYFKRDQGARTAAVVSYNQASSAAYARLITQGLKAEGYRVVNEQVDFALPNFRAVAADLGQQGADLVFDALDTHGNAQLCEAMDAAGVRVTAKVTNVQNWNSSVPKDFKNAPTCRNALWVTGSSRNYEDAGHPAVRGFRDAMKGRELSQWQLEGWAAAMWFTDAAKSCVRGGAAELTRACVERFLNRPEPYTARGLLLPVSYEKLAEPPKTRRTCLSVARWQDGKGWVSQSGEMNGNCFTVPQLPYQP